MSAILKKLIFFEDEALKDKIESVYGQSVGFVGSKWKKTVDNLCSMASELRTTIENQQKPLLSEISLLKQNYEILKRDKSRVDSDLFSVDKTLKEIYEREVKVYEEKVME